MTKRRQSRAQLLVHNIGNEINDVNEVSASTASQIPGISCSEMSENERAVNQKPESVARLTAAGSIAKGNGGRSKVVSERIIN